MNFVQLWWLSQVVGPVFEPGLVLEFFCFPASRSWVRTSPSPYFFAMSMSRKISRCLAGVLLKLQCSLRLFTTGSFSNFQSFNKSYPTNKPAAFKIVPAVLTREGSPKKISVSNNILLTICTRNQEVE